MIGTLALELQHPLDSTPRPYTELRATDRAVNRCFLGFHSCDSSDCLELIQCLITPSKLSVRSRLFIWGNLRSRNELLPPLCAPGYLYERSWCSKSRNARPAQGRKKSGRKIWSVANWQNRVWESGEYSKSWLS